MEVFKYKLRFRKRALRKLDFLDFNHVLSQLKPIVKNEEPKIFENITKSQQDAKIYRGIVLENGIKVLLISDPTTSKSASCLTVEVGHMSDPNEIPGLAHLCEHAMFLGSEMYPNENDFRLFLNENGGTSNAQTFADVTKYFFDIVPEKLAEALDRFSQMFIAPLFNETAVMREISAVNSEHEKNVACDAWRIRMINKVCANKNHSYCKFGTGNKDTLVQYGIDIRKELLEFYNTWYRSGNLMNLVVMGKDPPDVLETMVRKYFLSGIKNKKTKMPVWSDEVFSKDSMMTKTFVVPIKDVRSMTLSFQTPNLLSFYKSRPEQYIVNLLGHEGPGSVLAELRRLSWSTTLNCDHIKYANGFGFFEVKVDLTDEGYEHMDDIVKLIFQYVNIIRHLGIQQWIFEEYRSLSEMEFRFEDQKSPITVAAKIASCMRHYQMPDVLTGPLLVYEWRPDLIEFVLKMLTPENLRIVIVDQTAYYKCNNIEPIYQTKYGIEHIRASTIREWQICGMDKNLHLPEPNLFIPTDFEFLPIKNWKQTFPRIIRDSSFIRVWFKQDTEFRKPKTILTIELKNPTIHCDPLNWNLAHLFVWMLEDHLKEKLFAAELAGLEWRLAITTAGIRIFIEGFSHKQDIFLETILKEMFRYKIDLKRFEETYDSYLTDLKSMSSEKPQQMAIYFLELLLIEHMWSNEELIAAMKLITINRLKTFMKEILSQTYADCFIFGNVNEEKALQLSAIVEDRLSKARSLSKSSMIIVLVQNSFRERKLNDGDSFVFQIFNNFHKVNCTSVFVHCGLQEDKTNVLLDLVLQILKAPFFDVLRTQEQQGYLVDCLIRRTNGTQGIKFVVESTKHPEFIEERIRMFLISMTFKIEEMGTEKFENHKQALMVKKLQNPLTLASQFWQFHREIANQQYHFNRANVEASILKKITQEDVLEFYKTYLAPESKTRRSISMHVMYKTVQVFSSSNNVIENLTEFKNSLSIYPRTKAKSIRQFYVKSRNN